MVPFIPFWKNISEKRRFADVSLTFDREEQASKNKVRSAISRMIQLYEWVRVFIEDSSWWWNLGVLMGSWSKTEWTKCWVSKHTLDLCQKERQQKQDALNIMLINYVCQYTLQTSLLASSHWHHCQNWSLQICDLRKTDQPSELNLNTEVSSSSRPSVSTQDNSSDKTFGVIEIWVGTITASTLFAQLGPLRL